MHLESIEIVATNSYEPGQSIDKVLINASATTVTHCLCKYAPFGSSTCSVLQVVWRSNDYQNSHITCCPQLYLDILT